MNSLQSRSACQVTLRVPVSAYRKYVVVLPCVLQEKLGHTLMEIAAVPASLGMP